MSHVHGLGVDPSTKRLYVATHHGLFAADEGDRTPEPVSQSRQDIMGFSIAGPDRFIGSGHPSLDQDLPPHLGLIESRDGGRTWQSVSLLGAADFHVLEVAGDHVYGVDALESRLLASRDGGRHWQQRTPPAAVFDLTVDPDDPRRILASTQAGLFSSADGGRRWRPVAADHAGLLAWPAADALHLVDGQGGVHVSRDGGRDWRAVGDIGGAPAAFIADGSDLYAALADGTVRRSTDGGATWSVRTTA